MTVESVTQAVSNLALQFGEEDADPGAMVSVLFVTFSCCSKGLRTFVLWTYLSQPLSPPVSVAIYLNTSCFLVLVSSLWSSTVIWRSRWERTPAVRKFAIFSCFFFGRNILIWDVDWLFTINWEDHCRITKNEGLLTLKFCNCVLFIQRQIWGFYEELLLLARLLILERIKSNFVVIVRMYFRALL